MSKFTSLYTCPHCSVKKRLRDIACDACRKDHDFVAAFKQIIVKSKSLLECSVQVNNDLNTNLSRQTVTRLAKDENCDISHFIGRRGRFFYTIENTLIENSPANQQILKTLVLRHKIIDHLCCECGIGQAWNGKPLVLQLDHMNGVKTDNRKENLRFLCPNCHSQTETFCGRNKPSK